MSESIFAPCLQPTDVAIDFVDTPFSTVYTESIGINGGEKVIFLHGGPGSGLDQFYYRFFDLNKYQVIGYEQGGCCRSRLNVDAPVTSQMMVDELDCIRRHFNENEITLFGSSWGSTLALLYAIMYPGRCKRLYLHGFWLGSVSDIKWMFSPTDDKKMQSLRESGIGVDIIKSYRDHLQSMDVAKRYASYFDSINTLDGSYKEKDCLSSREYEKFKTQLTFFANDLYLERDFIEHRLFALKHVPILAVHGDCDAVCSPGRLRCMAKRHENITARYSECSGHSRYEQNTAKALMEIFNGGG